MQQWPKFTSVTFVFREIINFFSYTVWLLNFCFSKNHFIIILIRFHSPIVLMIYRLVIVTIKSGLRADKPVSFLSWYAEMILNSTRPWIWTEFSYFRLQLEFSSKISTYQVWFCIKIWANIVAGNRCIQICLSCRVFFCNADFTLYACFFLAGYHLKCFGDGCISAGDVFEKEEEDGVSAIVELEEDVCLYEGWGYKKIPGTRDIVEWTCFQRQC